MCILQKHLIGFRLDTPEALFHNQCCFSGRAAWLDLIRKTVWERTADESHYVSSYEALGFHWKHCTWFSNYWRKAEDNEIHMPGDKKHDVHVHVHYTMYMFVFTDLSSYGWQREKEQLQVVWDSEENLQKIQRTVDYITQGCKCKTGCQTRRCKCIKGILQCGPSCLCVNCKNTLMYIAQNKETKREIQEEIYEETWLPQDGDDTESEGERHGDTDIYSTDENRLDGLNQEVDQLTEDVFGVPF